MTQTEAWTIGRLLTWTADYLKEQAGDTARLDAELLLAEARGCSRIDLYTEFNETANEATRTAFRELVRRRALGEPVAYLVGRKEFYSETFRVTPDVLIPRPETELLVVALLDHIRERTAGPPPVIADVGTGCGNIAIAVAKHCADCHITAIDISRPALDVAAANIAAHGVESRVELVQSDLFDAIDSDRKFDYVASNPPYISTSEMESLAPDVKDFEPSLALLGGLQGTEVIRRLIDQSRDRLQPGGWLLFELSPMICPVVEQQITEDPHFRFDTTVKDLAGSPRVVQAEDEPLRDPNPNLWLALLAVDAGGLPSENGVFQTLAQIAPDLPPVSAANRKGNVLTFSIGDATAALTWIPRAIEWSQLEGPCEIAWYWPQAREVMRNHASHVIVTLLDEGTDPISKCMKFTQLLAAIAEHCGTVGIYWGASKTVHEPRAFLSLTREMTRDHLPLYLWIDFRVEAESQDTLMLYTTGLEAMGYRELEVRGYRQDAQKLVENVYNVAHYQIDKGDVIKDGDTVELTDEQQVTARHIQSIVDSSLDVIRLEFSNEESRTER